MNKALERGDLVKVSSIVSDPAKVAMLDATSLNTALIQAADKGNLSLLQMLRQAGVDPAAVDRSLASTNEKGLLVRAIQRGAVRLVSWLLGNGVPAQQMDAKWNPLYVAYLRDRYNVGKQTTIEIMELLIDNGADPNAPYNDKKTLLEQALDESKFHIVRSLIAKGADTNRDGAQMTLLHRALRLGPADMTLVLIRSGARVNAADQRRSTPLHYAAGLKDPKKARILLSAGANVDARDAKGDSPLHVALRNSAEQTALILMEAGANCGVANLQQETPLQIGITKQLEYVIVAILARGTSVSLKDISCAIENDKAGEPPLFLGYLVKSDEASVHRTDENGWTCLHHAAERDVNLAQGIVLDLFTRAGLGIDVPDMLGQTPLHVAARYGSMLALEGLIGAGADIEAEDEEGNTPSFIAERMGRERAAERLILARTNGIFDHVEYRL